MFAQERHDDVPDACELRAAEAAHGLFELSADRGQTRDATAVRHRQEASYESQHNDCDRSVELERGRRKGAVEADAKSYPGYRKSAEADWPQDTAHGKRAPGHRVGGTEPERRGGARSQRRRCQAVGYPALRVTGGPQLAEIRNGQVRHDQRSSPGDAE